MLSFRFSLRGLFIIVSVLCLVLAGIVNYPEQTALITIWASLTSMGVLAIVGISSAMTWLCRSAPQTMVEWWVDSQDEKQPQVGPEDTDGPSAR
jgi:hypothetical protein